MDLDAVTAGRHREDVDQEPGDCRIRAEEQVPAQDATGDEVGGSGSDLAGLAHDRCTITSCRARVISQSFRQFDQASSVAWAAPGGPPPELEPLPTPA